MMQIYPTVKAMNALEETTERKLSNSKDAETFVDDLLKPNTNNQHQPPPPSKVHG
jgi:hypothetical protein